MGGGITGRDVALQRQLRAHGYACRMAGIQRLAELEQEIAARTRDGSVDGAVARERLGFFQFAPPEDLPGALSVIVVAVPLPVARLFFRWKGSRVPVSVPPAYIHFDRAGREVLTLVTSILAPAGFRAVPAMLPEKLLAARMGLAAYGRNNITYVRGMGSLLRLATFATDLPPEEEHWQAPSLLPRCERCRSCMRACPTGAIAPDRVLLHTERCLVFHNERPGTTAFPAWISPSSHGCLVGCMRCQETCPENAGLLDRVVEEGEFTEDDTAALLDGVSQENLPADLRQRLERSDLLCLYGLLSRNLRAVLSSANASTPPARR